MLTVLAFLGARVQRRRDRKFFAMKVLVLRTGPALEDARREKRALDLNIPGCLSLEDYHEEVSADGTGVVYFIMPCVPSAGPATFIHPSPVLAVLATARYSIAVSCTAESSLALYLCSADCPTPQPFRCG